jgi:hypothetical protein
MSVTERLGGFLVNRTSRRSFLARTTMAATALSIGPVDYLIRPGTAYAQICECVPGMDCDCSAPCCNGYTQFCCTINNGINACPPGTFAGGWWLAEGSIYCSGARYYIDCMGECHGCGCGDGIFCPSCDGLTCECAQGTCDYMHVGCVEFRYGQCNQQISCSGVIACRVVSCTPPWLLGYSCTSVAQTDDFTADQSAPCQNGPTSAPPPTTNLVVGMAATPTGNGYWTVDGGGIVRAFGGAVLHGDLAGVALNKPVVGIASTPTGDGYWMVAADGGIFSFGDARFDGSTGNIALAKPIVGMSEDPATGGYRLVASDGGVFDFDAGFYGSLGDVHLNAPVVGMAAAKTGTAYWLVAADGGVFTFGNLGFYGSLGDVHLNAPVVGMAATPTDRGYWLVAADGGVFTFGDARFYGSLGAVHLDAPVSGMAATPSGAGYWLVAEDGGLFTFGDAAFYGSGAS